MFPVLNIYYTDAAQQIITTDTIDDLDDLDHLNHDPSDVLYVLAYLTLQEHSGLEVDNLVSDPGLEVNSPGAITDVSGDGLEFEGFRGEHNFVDVRHDLSRLVSIGQNVEEVRFAGEVEPREDALFPAAQGDQQDRKEANEEQRDPIVLPGVALRVLPGAYVSLHLG